MIPLEILVELHEIAFESWSIWPGDPAQPATESSIARVQKTLGIVLPAPMIELSRKSPSYGCWFASIGEDCDSGGHGILALNRVFHDDEDEPSLPANLILLNHGHDGDCDCWDLSAPKNGDEFPIFYCHLGREISEPTLLAPTFHRYLEQLCRLHAPRCPNVERRQRAQELLALYAADRGK